jgi:hypothetical protein
VLADVELGVPAYLEEVTVAVGADELDSTGEVGVASPELAQRAHVGVLRHGLGEDPMLGLKVAVDRDDEWSTQQGRSQRLGDQRTRPYLGFVLHTVTVVR